MVMKIVGWSLLTISALWSVFWAACLYGFYRYGMLDSWSLSQSIVCILGGLYCVAAGWGFRSD